jgi:prepilin-type N-terminal cleavage/methylation domain-containing protein
MQTVMRNTTANRLYPPAQRREGGPTLSWSRLTGNRGFTLFETLAATMILATALVVILQLLSGGLRSGHLAGRYMQAVFHAREKMEEMLLIEQLPVGALTGAWEDGFGWQVDIAQHTPDPRPEGEDPSITAETLIGGELTTFLVTVEVNWTEGIKRREVVLQTIALAEGALDDAADEK